MKRIGKPLDVANTVMWLTSNNASFITGQIIGVDGGFLAS
jgi:3-oxoacyl-[acyl-carrier protein] reductase